MENRKMQSLFRCNKRTGRYRPAKNPAAFTSYRVENGNLGKFEAVENHVTAFAPKKCLYQKVALGIENPNMQSLFRCNKRTGRYRPPNKPVSFTSYRAKNENLGKFEAVENHVTAFAPKKCL